MDIFGGLEVVLKILIENVELMLEAGCFILRKQATSVQKQTHSYRNESTGFKSAVLIA